MSRVGIKASVVMMVGLMLVGGSLPAAQADTVRRQDATGDAPAVIDIRTADYTHSDRRVSVVAVIPDLGDRGRAALSITRFTIFEAGYVVRIKKRAGSPPRVRLLFFDHFGLEPRECAAVSGRWGEDRIRLSVARACLDGHARNRVFVQFGIVRGDDVDRARAVRRLERG
jgi:hypothetical protein